jgi:hypothetical protein
VQESDLSKKGDETASLLDQPGPMSWPITVGKPPGLASIL